MAQTPSLALAFDIGGTNVRAGLVDETGRVHREDKAKLTACEPTAVIALCCELAERLHAPSSPVVGVGLAAMISASTGVVEVSPNLGWRNVDFGPQLRDALGAQRVHLLNDLDAICVGEATSGAAKGANDVACVFVGTGVGSGLLLNGAPYAGFRGVGAEIGHIKVGDAKRECGCGAVDCLEAYAGGRLLTERVRSELAATPDIAPDLDATDVQLDAIDALSKDNAWAGALWDEVAAHLGRAVANLVTVTNPEVVVMGGGVWEKCPNLAKRTRTQFDVDVNAVAAVNLRWVDATLGDRAGLIGAGAFALRRVNA